MSLSLSFRLFHIFSCFFSFVLFNFMLFWWSIFSGDDTNLNLSYACSVKNLNFFSHSSHSMAIDGTGLPVYSHKNSKSHVYCPSMIWVGDSLRSTLNLPNHAMRWVPFCKCLLVWEVHGLQQRKKVDTILFSVCER